MNMGHFGNIGYSWVVLEEEFLKELKLFFMNVEQRVEQLELYMPFVQIVQVILWRKVLLKFEDSFQ
jgi:hypothetical protein